MKIPDVFVPEKSLEEKTKELVWGPHKKEGLSEHDVKSYYWKFVFLRRDKDCTVEYVHDFFEELSYGDVLKIVDYGKIEKEKRGSFLEGLADIP